MRPRPPRQDKSRQRRPRKRLGDLLGAEFGDDVAAKQKKRAEITDQVGVGPFTSLADMTKEDASKVLDAIRAGKVTL